MRRNRGGKLILIAVMAVIVGWPAFQLYDWYESRTEIHQAGYLLYQVSLFQMELLNHHLSEAGKTPETAELEGLKQAAYSAAYAHERLVLAYGKSRVPELQSIPGLLQYILRFEIGGRRPLSADEAQMFKELQKPFNAFYADYAKLLSSGKNIIPAQNEKIAKTDRAMAELLRKKRLE